MKFDFLKTQNLLITSQSEFTYDNYLNLILIEITRHNANERE